MKPKARFGGKHGDKLEKFRISVSNFVKSRTGHDDGETHERTGGFVKKTSRKEARREKRRARKAKRRRRAEPGQSELPSSDTSDPRKRPGVQSAGVQSAGVQSRAPAAGPAAQKPAEKKPKRTVRFEDAAQQHSKKARLDTARRKALLEANEAEDKEIKKLEKRLGLNKRKNKKSLPQSFRDDGLDYILGILEPGVSEALLEDGEDLEVKSELERLKELSDSEEEEEDEDHAGAERDADALSEEEGNEDADIKDDDDVDDEMGEEEEDEDDQEEEEAVEDDNDDDEEEDVPEDESVKSDGEEGTSEDKSTHSKQLASVLN